MSSSLPVVRAYLRGIEPRFDLPYALSETVELRAASAAPSLPGTGDEVIRSSAACVLDVINVEDRMAIVHATNAVAAIRVASRCSVLVAGYGLADGSPMESHEDERIIWGHYDRAFDVEDAEFVATHFTSLLEYHYSMRYSRIGNAMRLHSEAMHTRNADLALLGFVGAMESLFSIATQELSFRLSLLLARFLGDDASEQYAYFGRARELYKIRSKIAHGDKIATNEENAAIQIVEHWTPEAEELARRSLRRIFDKNTQALFDVRKDHDALLISLLFEPNLDAALSSVA